MKRYKILVIAVVLIIIVSIASYVAAKKTYNLINNNASISPQQTTNFDTANSNDSNYLLETRGFPQEVPLSQAVEDCNRRIQKSRVGKTQQPLTVDEVLAAIRDWNNKEDRINPQMYNVIKEIAKTEMMPKGAYFFFATRTIAYNGYDIDYLRIYLRVGLDKYPNDVMGMPVYHRQIRSQYISSHPTTSP